MKTVMKIESSVVMSGDIKVGQIYLYDDISPDDYNFLGQKIESETSSNYIRDRLSEAAGCDELEIHISSRGGDVRTGFNLYSQIQAFQAKKKTAYIEGIAASIATVIAMAADEVVMNDVGLLMIHNASAGVYGNANDLRKTAEDLDVITGAAKNAYLAHAGGKISEEELTRMMDAETWLTAEQCLKYGLCDRIETGTKGAGISAEDVAAVCKTDVISKVNLFAALAVKTYKQKTDALEQQISELRAELSAKPDNGGGAPEQCKPEIQSEPKYKPDKMASMVAAALIGLNHSKSSK